MANSKKDFLTVAQNIDSVTKEVKRGRPKENIASNRDGRHLTLYLNDELYSYVDSMSRLTCKSKSRYITDLLTADKEHNGALYANVLELQKKM